jgi:hypothetical protein
LRRFPKKFRQVSLAKNFLTGLACARAFLSEGPRVAIVSRAEAKKLGVSPITVSKDLKEAKKE